MIDPAAVRNSELAYFEYQLELDSGSGRALVPPCQLSDRSLCRAFTDSVLCELRTKSPEILSSCTVPSSALARTVTRCVPDGICKVSDKFPCTESGMRPNFFFMVPLSLPE